jgi:hypothetical protein
MVQVVADHRREQEANPDQHERESHTSDAVSGQHDMTETLRCKRCISPLHNGLAYLRTGGTKCYLICKPKCYCDCAGLTLNSFVDGSLVVDFIKAAGSIDASRELSE